MIDLVLIGIESEGFNDVADLQRIGNTNFIYGGLNLIYAPPSHGKSWQIVTQFSSSHDVFYIDTDGSNGKQFSDWCKLNNVNYIPSQRIDKQGVPEFTSPTIINKVGYYILHLTLQLNIVKPGIKPIFILDSFTSINEGGKINNAEDVSPIFYKLNKLSIKINGAIILIDHATVNKDMEHGFKCEGNVSAKFRATVSVNKYIALNPKHPEKGGSFLCERARSNEGGLKIGMISVTNSVLLQQAQEWFKSSKLYGKQKLTKNDWTTSTKNPNQLWLRDFYTELFEEIEGKTAEGKTVIGLRYKESSSIATTTEEVEKESTKEKHSEIIPQHIPQYSICQYEKEYSPQEEWEALQEEREINE